MYALSPTDSSDHFRALLIPVSNCFLFPSLCLSVYVTRASRVRYPTYQKKTKQKQVASSRRFQECQAWAWCFRGRRCCRCCRPVSGDQFRPQWCCRLPPGLCWTLACRLCSLEESGDRRSKGTKQGLCVVAATNHSPKRMDAGFGRIFSDLLHSKQVAIFLLYNVLYNPNHL